MEKKLQYFTDEFLDYAYSNQTIIEKKMLENDDNIDWIREIYGKNPFATSPYSFDLELESDLSDFEAGKKIYETFKSRDLGDAIIYNDKFLSGFIFTYCYKYYIRTLKDQNVKNIYLLTFIGTSDKRRKIVRNPISMLYRTFEMTVDETLEDKYLYTKFVFENSALLRMKYYPHLDSPKIHLSFIKAFMKWKKDTNKEIHINSTFEMARKHLSVLQNVSEVEFLSEDYLVDYTYNYLLGLK